MTWIQQIFGPSVQGVQVASVALGGYFLGCLTTGYYLVRFRLGKDIRDEGSGSVGARNVGRLLGMPGLLITLVADLAKGALAVSATRYFVNDEKLAGLAMLAVVLGHVWPLQLGFHGGKGVATSVGALAAYDVHVALAFGLLFAALFCLWWRTMPAGLLAFALLPAVARLMEPGPFNATLLLILAGIILVAHRRNLTEEFALFAASRHAQPKPDESFK